MFTFLRRIIRFGWHNFWRDSTLNIATVFILTVAITLIAFLFVSQGALKYLVTQIQDKIDISVYLKPDSTQDEISAMEERLARMPEVKDINFVSKEDALKKFKERHKNDPVLLESLEVVGTNPFYPALNIKATDPNQYATILTVVNSSSQGSIVHKVDYVEKKTVIEKLSRAISNINAVGLFLAISLGIIAVLVAFNTIRVAIYNSSKEISIMRLVGAPNGFVRGPFIVQGVIAGIIAAFISFLILFLVTYFLGPKTEALTNGFNLFHWFRAHLVPLFFLQFFGSIAIGVVSGMVAIRKYLRA